MFIIWLHRYVQMRPGHLKNTGTNWKYIGVLRATGIGDT